ncbi:hypothetical protein HK097_006173 [Rhizophlyctis rosea]|uniref:Mid2 domain-containing protein n=1 Tax=Rhizophlyctis rosea TaxID=64517 RepID=A0AAD5SQS8_9FUNG|nr:hypothetical protein HK097_006173 [Rhizophlyctis rosea]
MCERMATVFLLLLSLVALPAARAQCYKPNNRFDSWNTGNLTNGNGFDPTCSTLLCINGSCVDDAPVGSLCAENEIESIDPFANSGDCCPFSHIPTCKTYCSEPSGKLFIRTNATVQTGTCGNRKPNSSSCIIDDECISNKCVFSAAGPKYCEVAPAITTTSVATSPFSTTRTTSTYTTTWTPTSDSGSSSSDNGRTIIILPVKWIIVIAIVVIVIGGGILYGLVICIGSCLGCGPCVRITKKWDEEAEAKKQAKEAERLAQAQAQGQVPPGTVDGMQVAGQPVPVQMTPVTPYSPAYPPTYAAATPMNSQQPPVTVPFVQMSGAQYPSTPTPAAVPTQPQNAYQYSH